MVVSKLKKKKEMVSVEEDEGEPLSPMARVYHSPGNDCYILTKIGCKTKINADFILNDLDQHVSKHRRFSCKLSDDGVSWIKTEVNIQDHVFIKDIEPNKILEDGESFVDNYVSHLTMLPLDKSKPLWDIHILNIRTSDAEVICVIRSHHSLGDGTSLMSLLVACTQKTSNLNIVSNVLKRRSKMVHKDKLPWFLRLVITGFSRLRLFWNTFVDVLLAFATAWFLKDTKTSLKGSVDVADNPKKFCHRIVSLDEIKFIKEYMNMTINDVLLGATQAALSQYLNNFPCKIRLTAGVFVNLRSDIGIQPLAKMMAMNSKCRWGNYLSSIRFPISIGLENDPLVYLSKAKATMDRKKHSLAPVLIYSIINFIFAMFGHKVGSIFLKRVFSNTTTCISNMIGPMEEISFHGHPISYIAPSVYGHAHALTIHFVSYAEKMVISLGVDPTVIPNPQKLCDEMENSLKAMKAALSERGL